MALNAKSTPQDIVTYRYKIGLNQSQFWSPLGVTQSGGSRYESGRALPKPVLKLLVIAYGTKDGAQKMIADVQQQKTRG